MILVAAAGVFGESNFMVRDDGQTLSLEGPSNDGSSPSLGLSSDFTSTFNSGKWGEGFQNMLNDLKGTFDRLQKSQQEKKDFIEEIDREHL